METNVFRRDGSSGTAVVLRIFTLGVLLAAVLLATGCGSEGGTSGLNGMTRTPPTEVGTVQLPNRNADSEAGDALKARGDGLMLVYFGYTSCPDVCPTTLADLRLALEGLDAEQRDRVEVAMVTVDPDRDTGKVLNGYLGHFFPKERFASFVPGTAAQLAVAEEAFGASHELGEPHKDGSYDVDHTAQVFAVDKDGVVKVEWAFGTDAEAITSDLEQLLSENTHSKEKE